MVSHPPGSSVRVKRTGRNRVKSTKRLECLVLRGASVDREILVSCDTRMKWNLIHDTFGRETVTDYVYRNHATRYNISNSKLIRNKCKNINSMSQLYSKSQISTDDLLGKIPSEWTKLREK